MTSADDFIIQLLSDKGLVSADVISDARSQLEGEGVGVDVIDSRIIDLLVEKKYTRFEDIVKALSEEFGIPEIDLNDLRIEDDVKKLLPKEEAVKYGVFPISVHEGQLEIAISDPLNVNASDDISHLVGMPLDMRLASPDAIKRAIEEHYGSSTYDGMFEGVGDSSETGGITIEEGASEEEAPIIRYVNKRITEAVRRRASDIHLEPLERR